MDSPENAPEIKNNAETTYPVRLRTPVFSFLAEGLRPAYRAELEEVQKDGSYKGLQEFHSGSRISRVMGEILDQFPDSQTLPESPTLHFSKEDISFLKEKIARPNDSAGSALWREMMREVDSSFSDARLRAKTSHFIESVKSRLRR